MDFRTEIIAIISRWSESFDEESWAGQQMIDELAHLVDKVAAATAEAVEDRVSDAYDSGVYDQAHHNV